MKHYLTTFFLAAFCYVNLFPKPPSVMQTKNDPEKIDIIIENKENPNKDERNLNAFLINPYIDKLQAKMDKWKFDRLNRLNQAILLLSLAHYYGVGEVEKAVVINVAVSLAKKYLDYNDYKFVNAILDNVLC